MQCVSQPAGQPVPSHSPRGVQPVLEHVVRVGAALAAQAGAAALHVRAGDAGVGARVAPAAAEAGGTGKRSPAGMSGRGAAGRSLACALNGAVRPLRVRGTPSLAAGLHMLLCLRRRGENGAETGQTTQGLSAYASPRVPRAALDGHWGPPARPSAPTSPGRALARMRKRAD